MYHGLIPVAMLKQVLKFLCVRMCSFLFSRRISGPTLASLSYADLPCVAPERTHSLVRAEVGLVGMWKERGDQREAWSKIRDGSVIH